MIARVMRSSVARRWLSECGAFLLGAHMPFGRDCEFPDFDACVAAMSESGAEDPRAVCAALMKETEED